MNLSFMARALGGGVSGRRVLAPGPGHSRHDRSLSVLLSASDPDGFTVHSFAGDPWQTCRDYVKTRLGIYGPRPLFAVANARCADFRQLSAEESAEDQARTARVIPLWEEARDIKDSPVTSYFGQRGIRLGRLPLDIHEALRWHPCCPWGAGRHGCLIALMTDVVSGAARAIHRTALSPSGEKVGKKMLGPTRGCVVRLWQDDSITTGLVLGEGIETTLSAATRIHHRGTCLAPAWASCSAITMAKFPVLSGVESLTLLVDNDDNGAGQLAAEQCSGRWTCAGCEVVRLIPNQAGSDFNDIVRQEVE